MAGINGKVLSVFPVTADVSIEKFFTNSGGTRYAQLKKWSTDSNLSNSTVTVNVIYSDV